MVQYEVRLVDGFPALVVVGVTGRGKGLKEVKPKRPRVRKLPGTARGGVGGVVFRTSSDLTPADIAAGFEPVPFS